jgi:hypothetical protein
MHGLTEIKKLNAKATGGYKADLDDLIDRAVVANRLGDLREALLAATATVDATLATARAIAA